MNLTDVAVLLAAGVGAGMVNAIAGGGSLIVFPSLVGIGLGAVPANVTNSVGVSPGYFSSVYGSRTELRQLAADRGWGVLLSLAPTAVAGSAAGSTLLLVTPAKAFDVVVPFLVLGAAAILAFQDRFRAVVGHPRNLPPRRRAAALHTMVGLGAVYGGYFGAAMGVLVLAALGLVMEEPMARVNALKNCVSSLVGGTTVLIFAVFGPVNWVGVAVVAPATVLGGYAGARVARRLPPRGLRAVVVVFATVVGLVLLVRALA